MTVNEVAKLAAPPGWKWVTKPSNRVRGTIELDKGQGIGGTTKLSEIVTALFEWAIKNKLGLTPDGTNAPGRQWFNVKYDDYQIQAQWRVSVNKPDSTKHYFDGSFKYPCCGNGEGGNIKAGLVHHDYCGSRVACGGCSVSGIKLHQVRSILNGRNRYLCHDCAPICTKTGCENRQWAKEYGDRFGGVCAEHAPVVSCFACGVAFERDKATKTTYRGEDREACPKCARNVCKTCNVYHGSVGKSDKRECKTCKLAHVDKDVEKHTTFTASELPKGGSLIIKDLPERPYRIMSIETEMDGDKDVLAGVLYRCGVVRTPEVESYNSYPRVDIPWTAHLKHDGSVSAGELIFHCMNLDTEEHADALLHTLTKLRGMEKTGHINFGASCGGHIHIDAHNFGYGDVWRLITVWNYLEDVIFRLAGAGSEHGHRSLHPGYRPANGHGYAHLTAKGPFGSKAKASQSVQGQERHSGLNFVPYIQAQGNCGCGAFGRGDGDGRDCTCNLGKRTIEWRVWNSTGNPRILHAWLAFQQALHSYCDTGEDPTANWENDFPSRPFTKKPYNAKDDAEMKVRLEWVFKNLMLTNDERDSLVYALKQSELKVLGAEFLNSLLKIVPAHAFPNKQAVRHHAKRQVALKIELPSKSKQVKAEAAVGESRARYGTFVEQFTAANARLSRR